MGGPGEGGQVAREERAEHSWFGGRSPKQSIDTHGSRKDCKTAQYGAEGLRLGENQLTDQNPDHSQKIIKN